MPLTLPRDETFDTGSESGTPVDDGDYQVPFAFTGTIDQLTFALDPPKLTTRITVGAAYQYMNGGDADIDVERGPLAGRLQGDYKSYDFHFAALNLSWRL